MSPFYVVEGVNQLQGWSRQVKAVSTLLGFANHPLSPEDCHQLSELLDHLMGDMDASVTELWQQHQQRQFKIEEV